jgi:hypothetical protein
MCKRKIGTHTKGIQHNMTCSMRNSATLYPVSIEVGTNFVLLGLGGAEEDYTACKEVRVTAMPCPYEPHADTVKEKIGQLFVRELLMYLGTRYAQMRKMSPAFAQNIDYVRKLDSLSSCILYLYKNIDEHLFAHLTPYICQIVRQRYTAWAGVAEFYPNGCLYTCWLIGRLLGHRIAGPSPSRFAMSLQRLVLLQPLTQISV